MKTKSLLTIIFIFSIITNVCAAGDVETVMTVSGVKGGIIVLLDCGESELTETLRVNDSFLVQGLTADSDAVMKLRSGLQAKGVYGQVTVTEYDGINLPYIDNCINLIVCEQKPSVSEKEIMRVLVPNGVLCVKEGMTWKKTVKPRPSDIDDWTHYLHSPTNNAVSNDTVIKPPLGYLQWVGGPRYGRHHDHMSSASAMVTSSGRLFAIFDYANPLAILLPSDFKLVARDAFNGKVLWMRDISQWQDRMTRLKSGPSTLPRRLVADGDNVYVTLSLDGKLEKLDAATGKTLNVYAGTKGVEEILFSDGELILNVNPHALPDNLTPTGQFKPMQKIVKLLNAETGKVGWTYDKEWVTPVSLAADESHVVFYSGEYVICLDRKTGEECWRSEKFGEKKPYPSCFGVSLVIDKDEIYFAGSGNSGNDYDEDFGPTMWALDGKTGKTLWQAEHAPSGYRSTEDLFVIDGKVWNGDTYNSRKNRTERTGTIWGRDCETGKVDVEFMPDINAHWFHHRCYKAKATVNYILTSRTGIEFVDFRKKHWDIHHWVRGACLYGIMPANGMIYNPAHPCACYLETKLYGFNAVAPVTEDRRQFTDNRIKEADADRLIKGPAYDKPWENAERTAEPGDSWMMYRADKERSGKTLTEIPGKLKEMWNIKLPAKASQVVASWNRLYVAVSDKHLVKALNPADGSELWSFTAGGKIDSSPVVYGEGRVLFGCADGYIYALHPDTGELVWKYLAAPADLRHFAFGQLESVWPVPSAVLIRKNDKGEDVLWAVAGKDMFVDGGMRLVQLNPVTGELIRDAVLDEKNPEKEGENLQMSMTTLNMPVAMNDILVANENSVYMKSQKFNLKGEREHLYVPNGKPNDQKGEDVHLFTPTGMLDDNWWHRSYWVYGKTWKSGAGGYYLAGRNAPSGRPMVFNDSKIYSFGRKPEFYKWTAFMEYQLYSFDKNFKIEKDKRVKKKKGFSGGAKADQRVEWEWASAIPVYARAMVLSEPEEKKDKGTLFLAGPPDVMDERSVSRKLKEEETKKILARQTGILKGSEGALLMSVSAETGEKISELKLESLPSFDGMSAAGGKLFLTFEDGTVACYSGE